MGKRGTFVSLFQKKEGEFYDEPIPLSTTELMNYLGMTLSNNSDLYEVNELDDRRIFDGGLGNDKIIGTSNDEVFKSL